MRRVFMLFSIAALPCLAAAPAFALMAKKPVRAAAALRDAAGQDRGRAQLIETGDGVRLTVSATGLPPGVHAVHVHTTGACAAPDFTSAGGHWNPTSRKHGMNNPDGKHLGDLPNMTVAADGTGTLSATITGGRIAEGALPLLDGDGAAVVVHANADDYASDPAGNAGGRIACGVITRG